MTKKKNNKCENLKEWTARILPSRERKLLWQWSGLPKRCGRWRETKVASSSTSFYYSASLIDHCLPENSNRCLLIATKRYIKLLLNSKKIYFIGIPRWNMIERRLTLKNKRNTILQIPRMKSAIRTFLMFWDILIRLPMILCALNLNPSSPCNWDTIIIIEVAEVKPDVTGIDIKSTKKPVYEEFHRLKYILRWTNKVM